MEKFAFLVSAYTEPDSLVALVYKLNSMVDSDIFIHIDKNVSITSFQEHLKNMDNVFFIKDRVCIKWGGYSQVLMQMHLIDEMLRQEIPYRRVINITGTDYPIVTKDVMIQKFHDAEVEYILGFDVENEEGVGHNKEKMTSKYAFFHFMDSNIYFKGFVEKLKLKRPLYDIVKVPIFFGSEYWALSYDCIKELYEEYKRHKTLQRLLKFSFAPSEAWIHTMFFNSTKWKDKAVAPPVTKYTGLINLSPITFFKYGSQIKVLDESDFDDVRNSERLFARKIIQGKSNRLVELLNTNGETKIDCS